MQISAQYAIMVIQKTLKAPAQSVILDSEKIRTVNVWSVHLIVENVMKVFVMNA